MTGALTETWIARGRQVKPVPVRVDVERIVQGFPSYTVWLFYGYDSAGRRWQIMNTTHRGIAEAEARRFQRAGIPMEVHKPWR